jgi:hypothetical protein
MFAVIAGLACAASGCAFYTDDAGDPAFVHQALQRLLCRKPRGVAEIRALNDVLALHGRGVVVDLLMDQPEFVDCWVPIVADAMQIARAGDLSQRRSCVNEPQYLVDGLGNACSTCDAEARSLADHIRDQAPKVTLFDPDGNGVGNPWNLHDSVRAAILVDDLHVAWRPWLFALAGRPHELGRAAADIRDNYLATAFNVKTECVSCHSSTYSKTEVYLDSTYALDLDPRYEYNTWDRTVPPGFDLHGSAFATSATATLTNDATYNAHCVTCHGAAGSDWPPTNTTRCAPEVPGTFPQAPKPLVERVPLLSKSSIVAQILGGGECMPPIDLDGDGLFAGDGDVDEQPRAEALADFLRNQLGGWQELDRFLARAQFTDPTAVEGPWGLSSTTCGFTWGHDLVSDTALHSFGGRPVSFTDVANITFVLKTGLDRVLTQTGWAGSSVPADPNLPRTPDPEAAVALLLAANIADDLIEELTGGRGTVAHGLSRVKDQQTALAVVTAAMLVDDGTRTRLSLKSALKLLLLSPLYNRNAPDQSTLPTAYELPMFVNPWAATPDGIQTSAGDNRNGQGDLVHRRTPNEIFRSLNKDLGWRAPAVYPLPTGLFPSGDLMRQIGRYESDQRPGTTQWQFSSLLLWEAGLSVGKATPADDGPCANPASTDDYIDRLVEDAFLAASIPTMSELSCALKDRLLQEPVLDEASGEEALVGQLLDGALDRAGTLSMPANTWPQARVKSALRQYCSALVLSPDYLLENLPTLTAVPAAPPFQVCINGEPCTETDLAAHYCTELSALGLACPL